MRALAQTFGMHPCYDRWGAGSQNPADRQTPAQRTITKSGTGAVGWAATPGDTGGGTAPVSRRQTMRAIMQAGFGSADVLHLEETASASAASGEVLLYAHAAGLDRDSRWRAGRT